MSNSMHTESQFFNKHIWVICINIVCLCAYILKKRLSHDISLADFTRKRPNIYIRPRQPCICRAILRTCWTEDNMTWHKNLLIFFNYLHERVPNNWCSSMFYLTVFLLFPPLSWTSPFKDHICLKTHSFLLWWLWCTAYTDAKPCTKRAGLNQS